VIFNSYVSLPEGTRQKPAEFDRFLYLCGLSISGFRVKSLSGCLFIWLVVEPTPLKNMSSSVGMMTFPIYGKTKHVPNHQPDVYMWVQVQSSNSSMPGLENATDQHIGLGLDEQCQ